MEKEKKVELNNTSDLSIACQNLARFIEGGTRKENTVETTIVPLTLHRFETITEPTSYLLESSICLIAQGVKRVLLGKEAFTYRPGEYLISSVGLPIVGQIIEADSKSPYLGITLRLDKRAIAQLMVDSNLPSPNSNQSSRGMAIGKVSHELIIAFQRLIALLDEPKNIPILSPLIQREILFRLLIGDQGDRLRQIATNGSQSGQISQAIDWLKNNYQLKLKVEDLAGNSNMSVSTFHHHFRELTAMSPLQFQKRLRLDEARRLMLTERLDAADAAFQVGYESPSQFSREYSRQFGIPPLRDIKNLNQMSAVGGI